MRPVTVHKLTLLSPGKGIGLMPCEVSIEFDSKDDKDVWAEDLMSRCVGSLRVWFSCAWSDEFMRACAGAAYGGVEHHLNE